MCSLGLIFGSEAEYLFTCQEAMVWRETLTGHVWRISSGVEIQCTPQLPGNNIEWRILSISMQFAGMETTGATVTITALTMFLGVLTAFLSMLHPQEVEGSSDQHQHQWYY